MINLILDEIKKIKTGKKELRDFGLTVGWILVILGLVAAWRGKGTYPYLLGIGSFLIISGYLFPVLLRPLQKAWMAFSVIMGFFMSRVILFIVFYIVITPIGLILRLFGKDILDQKQEPTKVSYWKNVDKAGKPKEYYENQY